MLYDKHSLIITICCLFFSFSLLGSSADTSIAFEMIFKENLELFKEVAINEEESIEFIGGDTVKLCYKNDTIVGKKIDGYYKVIQTSHNNFDRLVSAEFKNLYIGSHDKGKTETVIGVHYKDYKDKRFGWLTEALIRNLDIKKEKVGGAAVIKIKEKANLRDAIFSILVIGFKNKLSTQNLTIANSKLRFLDTADTLIKVNVSHLNSLIQIPMFTSTGDVASDNSYLLKTLCVLSLLLSAVLAFLWLFRWKQIVGPYKDILDKISSEIATSAINQEMDSKKSNEGKKNYFSFLYEKNSFSADSLFTVLMKNFKAKNSSGGTLNQNINNHVSKINSKYSIVNEQKEVVNSLNKLLNSLGLKDAFVDKIRLGHASPPPVDVFKELLRKTKEEEKLKETVKYIDKKYSIGKLSLELKKLYKSAALLKELSTYLKRTPEDFESSLETFAGKNNPTQADLKDLLGALKLPKLSSLINNIKNNEIKIKSFDKGITKLSANSNENTGISLIQKIDTALSILKDLDTSNNVNFISPCLEQLAKMYIIDKMLIGKPHEMKSISLTAINDINPVLKTNLSFIEKDKIVQAFENAQMAKESKIYFTNYFNLYKSFFTILGRKDLDDEQDFESITRQIIEMALHNLDHASQEKRGFANARINYLKILGNGDLQIINKDFKSAQIDTSHSDFINDYHVRNIIKYARKLKVKTLKNIFIDGYLISDEVLQTGKGSITKYTKR